MYPFSLSLFISPPWYFCALQTATDWSKVPTGTHRIPITIEGQDKNRVIVQAVINNISNRDQQTGFVETDGYISIEAEHCARATETNLIQWKVLPNFGRTLSGVTPFPVTAKSQSPGAGSPHLEYEVYMLDKQEVKVNAYLSPTLNFHNTEGLRFAISFDDGPPQIINLHENKSNKAWEGWVSDNILIKTSTHSLQTSGVHILKFWMVDPGVVLQKLVIETGDLKPSYLGPPESYHAFSKTSKKK